MFNLSNLKTRLRPDLLIYFLIGFHIFANTLWITLNNVPPTWDASLHTVLSIKFLEYAQNHISNFNLLDFLRITQYYPPLVHWVGSILALISNNDYKIIALSGTFFLTLGIFFLYRYTKELFQNDRIALFSSFFFSFFITIYQQSRDHMLDIPLAAFTITGLYFLKKSNLFQDTKYSILFALIFGLSFLTKWYSAIYFLVPLTFVLIATIKDQNLNKAFFRNVIIGFVIVLAIAAPWYLTNLENIIRISRTTSTAEFWNPHNLLSLDNLLFHLKLIVMFQVSFIGFLFFLLSSFLLVKNKNHSKEALLIFSVIIFNYLFFTFLPNKNIRYLIPLMPFLAIVMGFGLDNLLNIRNKLISPASAMLIPYFLLTYTILSFGFPIKPDIKYSAELPLLGWTDLLYLHTYPVQVIYQPVSAPYQKILSDIFAVKKGAINILILKDTQDFNNGTIDPYLYPEFKNRRQDFNYIGYDLIESSTTNKQIAIFLNNKVDVALVSVRFPGLHDYIREYNSLIRFQNYFLHEEAKDFILIRSYELPGDQYYPGDILLLYKKRGEHTITR